MTLMAHSILSCDLSIDMNLKRTRFVNTISAKNYRLALTARKTVVKFLKEIKVICFV